MSVDEQLGPAASVVSCAHGRWDICLVIIHAVRLDVGPIGDLEGGKDGPYAAVSSSTGGVSLRQQTPRGILTSHHNLISIRFTPPLHVGELQYGKDVVVFRGTPASTARALLLRGERPQAASPLFLCNLHEPIPTHPRLTHWQ